MILSKCYGFRVAMLCILLLSPSNSYADPPRMPYFNESIVQKMISKIEIPYNASLLKIGYFASHRNPPYATSKGLEFIDSTLIQEKHGTYRWFLLQTLRGFAAFHVPEVDVDEGFDAYSALFDNSDDATLHQTQAALRQSIRDFVSSIDTSLKRKGYTRAPQVTKLLVKAWSAWNNLPSSATDAKYPVNWGRAVEAAYAQDKFVAIVKEALKDPTPDFPTLKLAVIVFKDTDKPRAIELLQKAQKRMEPGNYNQQQWLYETWMELITGIEPRQQDSMKISDTTQLLQLVSMRKDQISYTGHGYADLLELYWRLGQTSEAQQVITIAHQPGIRAEEKVDVGKVLLLPPREIEFSEEKREQLQQQGVELLQGYLADVKKIPLNPPLKRGTFEKNEIPLNPPLKRGTFEKNEIPLNPPFKRGTFDRQSIRSQIRARYELGRYFVKRDMITEALQALNVANLHPPHPHTMTYLYWQNIQSMKARLQKKLEGVEGVK